MVGRGGGHRAGPFRQAGILWFTLCAGMLLDSCAGSPRTASPPVRRIGYSDLQRYSGFSAYQVVERLFPSILRVRPLTNVRSVWEELPQVYMSGHWLGDVTVLHDIPVTSVLELGCLTSLEALQRFGRESPRGAIEVVLKR